MSPNTKLTRKDFTSDQEVRWCPGCGDYAILAAVQRTLPEVGVKRENTVFISGIGCSSRFPYYMNTYGFHTIHGRAPALATGLKLANPELDVWMITGDGDGLSIGGNHLLHVLRRNVDLQILLFNNRIYGLTKGQYSPTSVVGQMSPSTPYGSVDQPVWPCLFALGSNARFVGRGYDTSKKLPDLLRRAHDHKGASFMEVLQNCPVYNDNEFDAVTDRKTADDSQLWVEHGKPLAFGKDRSRGVRLRPGTLELEVVELGDGLSENDLLVHDETNRTQAFLLAQLEMPVAFGVLYCAPTESYDQAVRQQVQRVREQKGEADLQALLQSGHTWRVDAPADAE
jgi:2-oxoglutarate/2-oxoacid ferredoxin oxidoreductase subunit beta